MQTNMYKRGINNGMTEEELEQIATYSMGKTIKVLNILAFFVILLTIFFLSSKTTHAAIANTSNTTTTYNFPVSTKTITISPSGTDILCFAITNNHTSLGSITGVTMVKSGGNTAMTLVNNYNNVDNSTSKVWIMINPDTGSNNVIATASGAIGIAMGASCFSGVSQTSPVEGTSTTQTGGNVTSFSQTATSTSDNSFAFWMMLAQNASAVTAGTNTTIGSQPETSAYGTAFAYSTAATSPAGGITLNVTSASQKFTGLMVTFKPTASAPVSSPKSGALIKFFRRR